MKRFPPNSSFCQEHGSMSVSAQSSSETSAVSKEVANLSPNLSPHSFWSITFSILPSCTKKSQWNSDPNTYLPQPGEVTEMKYFYQENMICAVHQWLSHMVCGLQAGHAERGDHTALTPLPLLPTWHWVHILVPSVKWQGTAKNAMVCSQSRVDVQLVLPAHRPCVVTGNHSVPSSLHLVWPPQAVSWDTCSRRGVPAVLCVHPRGYFSILHRSITSHSQKTGVNVGQPSVLICAAAANVQSLQQPVPWSRVVSIQSHYPISQAVQRLLTSTLT